MNALKSLTAAVPFRRRPPPPPTKPCAICMDDMVIGDKTVEKLSCNHHFHARCIYRWLCVKKNCPICRRQTVLPRKQLYRMLEATDPSMLYYQRQDVHVSYVEFKPPKFLWVYQLRDLIEALFPELYEHFKAKFGYR